LALVAAAGTAALLARSRCGEVGAGFCAGASRRVASSRPSASRLPRRGAAPERLIDAVAANVLEAVGEPLLWEEQSLEVDRTPPEELLALAAEEIKSIKTMQAQRAKKGPSLEQLGINLEASARVLEAVGIDRGKLQSDVIPVFPQLLRLDPEVLAATVRRLGEVFGGEAALAAAVSEVPALLCLRADLDVEPALVYLANMSGLGGNKEAAANLAQQSPGLLLWAAKGVVKEKESAAMSASVKSTGAGMAAAIGNAIRTGRGY